MFKATATQHLCLGAIAALGIILVPSLDVAAKNKPESTVKLESTDTVECGDGSFVGALIDAGGLVCEGPIAGNASNVIDESTELFDLTGWKQLSKIDTVEGQGDYSGSSDFFEISGDLDDGELKDNITWAFKDSFDLSNIGELFFTVKGGDNFSAYLWDGVSTSGTFNTQGIVTGSGKAGPGLSNIAIYYRGEDYSDPDPVPTPAAILPTLVGLLGAETKRRKNIKKEEDTDIS